MFISKVKLIACSVLVVAVVGTAAFTHGVSGSQEPVKPDQVQAPADKPAPPAAKVQREPEVVRLASPRDGVIVALGSITKRLRVGDRVQAGQTVVRLDDRLPLNELRIAQAKSKAAQAELEAQILTYKEAQARFQTAEKLWKRTPALIAEEDYRERKLAAEKYRKEVTSKEEAVNLAELEIKKAEIILDMHKISSPVDGVVSKIHRGPGEGVKALEPVIEIRGDK